MLLFIYFFGFFDFYSVVYQDGKVHYLAGFFVVDNHRSGRLGEIRGSVCISKSQRSFSVSFSRSDSGLCIYNLFIIFKLLAQFPVDHLPTQSCLVLYSLCANLLHSLIMCLIVSALSPHNLHLLFCSSYLFLI